MSKQVLKTYKIAKSRAENNEEKALQLAIQKTGLTSRFLKPQHTDKMFVFVQIR